MAAEIAPRCGDHPDAPLARWGKTGDRRRQTWVCLDDPENPHRPIRGVTEDLLGLCLGCERDWERGYPIATHAWYHVEQVVTFLRGIGLGLALGKAIREARQSRHDVLYRRANVTGSAPPPYFPPPVKRRVHRFLGRKFDIIRPEEDGRLAGDWLDRYGALLVARIADREWPSDKPLLVDATKFKRSSLYAPGTPQAGQPKRGGDWGFAVLAAGVPTASGFYVVHVRATPDDGFDSWVAFFQSLPGRPKSILADRWSDLIRAAEFVWPGIEIHASTWHTWDLLRRRFNKARMYPGTHPLVKDGEVALSDPTLFRAWRTRAMIEAPKSIQRFLKAEGNTIQARLDGEGPYATGPIEVFLKAVRKALAAGRGRVGNLARLDIRLALIAANTNRADSPRHYLHTLIEALDGSDLERLPWRELDGAGFKAEWVINRVVKQSA
jgi:hypothetical protein